MEEVGDLVAPAGMMVAVANTAVPEDLDWEVADWAVAADTKFDDRRTGTINRANQYYHP